VYALAAIFLWSTVASAFKLTLREIGVVELLFVATLVSFATLLVYVLATGRVKAIRDWSTADWLGSALLGALNPFTYYLVLFRAYDLLPAQEAQPLNYTWPIVLVLLSAVFLRQRLRARSVAAMLISFSGVAVISTRGNLTALEFTDVEGVALAVGSSLLWAAYWLLTLRSRRDQLLKLAVNFFFGSVYIVILAVATDAFDVLTLAGVGGAMYVGVFEMGVTFILWMKALQLTQSNARISNLVFLSPFFSLIVIHLVVGESIYPSTLAGLLLIVGGIVLQKTGQE
jgi:drug/metabolite transporter (DMT)-like permease